MKKLIWGILFIFVLFTQLNAYADLQVFGYVYDENDAPLENVKVSTKDNYNIFTDTTKTNGWYSFGSFYEGIKPQKYTFKYEKSGYQSLTKEIDFTTVSDESSYQVERVTLIKLPSTPTPTPATVGNIAGQVTEADTGAGIHGATVTVKSTGQSGTTAYVQGQDGVYMIQNIPVGAQTLTANATGFTSSSRDVTVVAGNPNPQTGANVFNFALLYGTPTPSSTPIQTGIAGTWKGYYTVPEFSSQPDDVTAYLEQNGNHITGKSYDQDGCEGTITGTIDGSIFTFEIQGKKSSNCCKSKFKGTAIITCAEDYMVMTFTIKLKGNCSGEAVGSGEFWKQ